jgi:flotillin
LKRATSSEKIQSAKALKDAYIAEQEAESSRAARERATQEADILVKAEIEKQKLELEAEAKAEQTRRLAKGDADAIYMKIEAEARGVHEILTKQALGYAKLVQAAGGDAVDATRIMLADKMEELMKIQVDAINGIKIDKVTVWDSMGGKDGSPATANFLSGMLKSIPPMNEMFKMAGMELPGYLGKDTEKAAQTDEANTAETETEAAATVN